MKYLITILLFLPTVLFAQLPTIDEPQDSDAHFTPSRGVPSTTRNDTLRTYMAPKNLGTIALSPGSDFLPDSLRGNFFYSSSDSKWYFVSYDRSFIDVTSSGAVEGELKPPTASFRQYYEDSTYITVSAESVSGKGVEGISVIDGVASIITSSGDAYPIPKRTGPSGVIPYSGALDIRNAYSHVGVPYFNTSNNISVGDSLATIGDRLYFSFTTDSIAFPSFTGAIQVGVTPANKIYRQYTARFEHDGLSTWYDIVSRDKDLYYDFESGNAEPDFEIISEGTGIAITNEVGYIRGVAVSPSASDSRGNRYQNIISVTNADIVFRAEKVSGTGSAGVIFYDDVSGDWFGVITSNGSSSTAIRAFSSTGEFSALSNRPFDADRDIEISFDGVNVSMRTQTTDNSPEYTILLPSTAIVTPRSSYKVAMYVGATTDVEMRLHELKFTRYER